MSPRDKGKRMYQVNEISSIIQDVLAEFEDSPDYVREVADTIATRLVEESLSQLAQLMGGSLTMNDDDETIINFGDILGAL
tara:strand:+ start:76 stop:318 length:243 start_codon:yes stop_codon:yes gene_type:complete